MPYISALKDGVLRHRADKADSAQIEENRKRNNAQFIMRDAMFEVGQVHSGRIIEANNLKIDVDNKKKQLDNYYISKDAESLQSKAPKQPKK